MAEDREDWGGEFDRGGFLGCLWLRIWPWVAVGVALGIVVFGFFL